MPTGEITLDYQTMLVNDLCEQLTSGDKVSNNLLSYEDQAGQLEIHLEKGVQTLTFPPRWYKPWRAWPWRSLGWWRPWRPRWWWSTDHEWTWLPRWSLPTHMPKQRKSKPANCPNLDTVISVFHLEEGEPGEGVYTSWWARTSFDMAALPMMGGHAHHHHHGHGDGPFAYWNFSWQAIWSMQKVGGAYDPTMLSSNPTATPDEANTMHSPEGGVEALIEATKKLLKMRLCQHCWNRTCFELHVGASDDSTFNMILPTSAV